MQAFIVLKTFAQKTQMKEPLRSKMRGVGYKLIYD